MIAIAEAERQPSEPHPHRWTKTEYYALAEIGIFNATRVELVEGEIIDMAPMTSKHLAVVVLVQDALRAAFGPGYFIVTQAPVDLGELSEPEPDVAVYAGAARDYLEHKPTTPLLVVEVADTSLRYDQGKKASLYAKAGVADYWIVNLRENILEVYRNPVENDTQLHGYGYNQTLQPGSSDTISPLALPDTQIRVADMLP